MELVPRPQAGICAGAGPCMSPVRRHVGDRRSGGLAARGWLRDGAGESGGLVPAAPVAGALGQAPHRRRRGVRARGGARTARRLPLVASAAMKPLLTGVGVGLVVGWLTEPDLVALNAPHPEDVGTTVADRARRGWWLRLWRPL